MTMDSGDSPSAQDVNPVVEASPSAVELSVEGMHCQSCVLLIEETLADVPAVRQVVVDLDAGRATVRFDAGDISVDALCAAVTGLGYPTSPLAPGDPGA
jgi:copper chaperone